jgi:adenine C2-methylase RlmN of 23S rRNA A2503 and tRNA A37
MEARFVQRNPDYFIAYLSSQTGCNKACRFCHLTQTGQTEMIDATTLDYNDQLVEILRHYINFTPRPVKKIHINFMARGEVFSNKYFLKNANNELINLFSLNARANEAAEIARLRDPAEILERLALETKNIFNLSTIMPEEIKDIEFNELFQRDFNSETKELRIYYSLYSMKESFRKRWIPKAIEPKLALNKLARFQNWFDSTVKLHWAFIKDENDSIEELKEIFDYCDDIGLKPKFNIVRYNPYSSAQGEEAPHLEYLRAYIASRIGIDNVKIIPRVGGGNQTYASCGMFVP